jgi:Cytochrome P450
MSADELIAPQEQLSEEIGANALVEGMADLSAAFGGGIDDPFLVYDRLRAQGDVVPVDLLAAFGLRSKAAAGEQPVFTLFRFSDIQAVLRDAATFTSSINQRRIGFLFDDLMILGMDGAQHKFMRSLLQPAFGAGVIARWKERMMAPLIAEEFIKPLLARGRCDLLADFAIEFPVRSVYHIIGLPDDPTAYSRFATWGLEILRAPTADPEKDPAGFAETVASAVAASKGMYDQLRPIIAARRASGLIEGDDLISSLLRASHQGESLDDHQIACFLRTVMPAAAETTTRTFCNLMLMLLNDADLFDAVRRDRSLIPAAIDEAVRLEPVLSIITRETKADTEIAGVVIPAGSAILLCAATAGRDEAAYPDPHVFDLHRPRKIPLGFGSGPHMCIGMQVAKAEMEAALNALMDMMPRLRLDPDYPEPLIKGVIFRGPSALHVRWD